MNTGTKRILAAGALIAAASTASAQIAGPVDMGPITVTGRQAAEDQRITGDVVNTIRNDPRLAPVDGYIGVRTDRRGEVTMIGRVPLEGQAREAGEDAESVKGVTDVDNVVRPRVGER